MITFFFVGGCATLPRNFNATPSFAIQPESSTSIGEIFLSSAEENRGKSAFAVLDTAKVAFLARVALTDIAEKTIDVQTYIWKGDTTGIILLDRLRKAADRGVRVRLLLDDITTHGKDMSFGAINSHPLIQIRVFNPLGRRFQTRIFRNLTMAFHVGRMTHRMHNKIFAVDNQAVIVGGRNIADEYFGMNDKSNFRDLDLFGAGPIARDTSALFDDYWNSSWSVPLEELGVKKFSKKKLEKKTKKFKKLLRKEMNRFPYPLDLDNAYLLNNLRDIQGKLIWAKAEAVADAPGKAWADIPSEESVSAVLARLQDVSGQTKEEVMIMSPYFIVSKDSLKEAKKRINEGIRVRVLTNSMMSTDVLPAVAHYKGLRKNLIAAGIELHETRPDAANVDRYRLNPKSDASHGLHSKVAVFDRKVVFVGTFNIDPRSEHLNTEVGILVFSPELGRRLAELIEEDLNPKNSWHLTLSDKGKILWSGVDKEGQTITFKSDPYAGFWKRFKAGFLSILPIKGQL